MNFSHVRVYSHALRGCLTRSQHMNKDWISAMPEQFPAAIVRERGKPLQIVNIPRLPLDEYDAIVRVQACSICAATDTHLVDGEFPRAWCAEPPFVIGHESAGKVVSIGP